MVSYSNTANPVNISLAGGLIGLGGLMGIAQMSGNLMFNDPVSDALAQILSLGMLSREGEALPLLIIMTGFGAALAQGTRTSYAF